MKINKTNIIIFLDIIVIILLVVVAIIYANQKKECPIPVEKSNTYICVKDVEEMDDQGNYIDTVVAKDIIDYNELGQVTSFHTGYIYEFENEDLLKQTIEEIQNGNSEMCEREDKLNLYIYTNANDDQEIIQSLWIKDVIEGKVNSGYKCTRK